MLNHQFRDPPWPDSNERPLAEQAEMFNLEAKLIRTQNHISQQLRIIEMAVANVKYALSDLDNFDRLCELEDEVVPTCWTGLEHPKDLLTECDNIADALTNAFSKGGK